MSRGYGPQIILNFNKYFHGFTELGITLCVAQNEMKISFFLFENFTVVLVISKTSSRRMHVDRPPKASSLQTLSVLILHSFLNTTKGERVLFLRADQVPNLNNTYL